MANNEPRIKEIIRAMLTGAIDYRAAKLQTNPIDINALREQKAQHARNLITQLSEPELDVLKSVVEGHSRNYTAVKLNSDSETIVALGKPTVALNSSEADSLTSVTLVGWANSAMAAAR